MTAAYLNDDDETPEPKSKLTLGMAADIARAAMRERYKKVSEESEPTGIEALVCKDIAARQALGINKCGTTVADNPLAVRAWLEHAYQE